MPAERRQCFFSSPNNRNEQQYFSISAGAGAANGEFTVLYNKYFNGNIPVELLKPLLDCYTTCRYPLFCYSKNH